MAHRPANAAPLQSGGRHDERDSGEFRSGGLTVLKEPSALAQAFAVIRGQQDHAPPGTRPFLHRGNHLSHPVIRILDLLGVKRRIAGGIAQTLLRLIEGDARPPRILIQHPEFTSHCQRHTVDPSRPGGGRRVWAVGILQVEP